MKHTAQLLALTLFVLLLCCCCGEDTDSSQDSMIDGDEDVLEHTEYDVIDSDSGPFCQDGWFWSESDSRCMPDCPSGTKWDPASQQCVPSGDKCPDGFYWNPAEQRCFPEDTDGDGNECPDGFYWDADEHRCIPMPTDGDNDNESADVCPEGYEWDPVEQDCIPTVVDGDDPEIINCYEDRDGDDYGNAEHSQQIEASVCPEGWTENDSDCNDDNNMVHPGNLEVCNGIDDNCIDGIDEGGNALCTNGWTCEGVGGCVPPGPCPDDGLWCNGYETFLPIVGCIHEYGPDGLYGERCQSDDVFCNGLEQCDEELDTCISPGDPCVINETDTCSEEHNSCIPENPKDLVVLSSSLNKVIPYVNQGDGNLVSPYGDKYDRHIDVGGEPDLIADLNGDGIPDVVRLEYINPTRNVLRVYLIQPDASKVEVLTEGLNFFSGLLAAGDINLDGNMDIVLAHQLDPSIGYLKFIDMVLLLGQGDGHFTVQPTQKLYRRIKPDTLEFVEYRPEYYPGIGSGNIPTCINDLSLVEATGDGYPDLLFRAHSAGDNLKEEGWITVFSFNGHGNEDPDVPSEMYEGNFFLANELGWIAGYNLGNGRKSEKDNLALGDMDHDGDLDLVAIDYRHDYRNRLWIFLNNQDSFAYDYDEIKSREIILNPSVDDYYATPGVIELADINGDTHLDVLAIRDSSHEDGRKEIVICLGNGDGTLQEPFTIETAGFRSSTIVADMDNNDVPDLIMPNFETGGIDIAFADSPLDFSNTISYFWYGNAPRWIETVDFNDDGFLDILLKDVRDDHVSVLYNQGDGSLLTPPFPSTGSEPSDLAFGMLNDDNFLDLAITNKSNDNLTIMYGMEDGTFENAEQIEAGNAPMGVVAGDFNSDEFEDLVVINSLDYNISFLAGTEGGFESPQNTDCGRKPTDIVSADWNSDNMQDIAVYCERDREISIWLGDGAGSFEQSAAYSVDNIKQMQIIDDNLDGRPDIVTSLAGDVKMLINIGDGLFAPESQIIPDARETCTSDECLANVGLAVFGEFNGNNLGDVIFEALCYCTYYDDGPRRDGLFVQYDPEYNGHGNDRHLIADRGDVVDIKVEDINLDGSKDLIYSTSQMLFIEGNNLTSYSLLEKTPIPGNSSMLKLIDYYTAD